MANVQRERWYAPRHVRGGKIRLTRAGPGDYRHETNHKAKRGRSFKTFYVRRSELPGLPWVWGQVDHSPQDFLPTKAAAAAALQTFLYGDQSHDPDYEA